MHQSRAQNTDKRAYFAVTMFLRTEYGSFIMKAA